MELHALAVSSARISEEDIDDAMENSQPKAAMIALLLKHEA
jgi:hypothetical protein